MAINDGHPKIPGSQGFKCNGGSRLPNLPDGDRAAISSSPTLPSSLSTLSRSLPHQPLPPGANSEADARTGKRSHRELPHEVIRHANGSPGWDSSPNPLRVGGRAATRIRRPRAIDPISRPSVAVSLGRPRSKDPPAPWDRSLLLFVGEEAPTSLESIVRFSSMEFEATPGCDRVHPAGHLGAAGRHRPGVEALRRWG